MKISCGAVCALNSRIWLNVRDRCFRKTDRFQKDTLKVDDETSHYSVCLNDTEKEDRASRAVHVDQTTLGRLFLKWRRHQYNRIVSLFNAAYTVGIYRSYTRPYTDFVWMSQMQKQNGLDFGGNYMNDKGCSLFVKQVATMMNEDFQGKLHKANFVTTMSDGSTDAGIVEQEHVNLWYVSDDLPKVKMVDVVDLKHSHADGVVADVDRGLGKIGISLERLADGNSDFPNSVSQNYDGASVNMGSVNGAAAKFGGKYLMLLQYIVWLTILNWEFWTGNNKYLKIFESTVKGIFKFYTYFHKRRRELACVGEIFNENGLKPRHFVECENYQMAW